MEYEEMSKQEQDAYNKGWIQGYRDGKVAGIRKCVDRCQKEYEREAEK